MPSLTFENQKEKYKLNIKLNIKLIFPILLLIIILALLPSRYTPEYMILEIPIQLKDILIIFITLPYAFLAIHKNRFYSAKKIWHKHFPIFFILTLFYLAFSVIWSGIDYKNTKAMLFVVTMSVAIFILSYSVIAQMNEINVKVFIWWLTILLAFVCTIYTAESYFNIGFRSAEAKQWTDFGIQRVRGPLFGSSYGFFILLPAIGFCLNKAILDKWNIINSIVAFFLFASLIGLGSRIGILLLLIFLIILIIKFMLQRQRMLSVLLIIMLLFASWWTITYKANISRFYNLIDPYRTNTYKTALRIYSTMNIAQKVFGKGLGSIWSWYLPDVTVKSSEDRAKRQIVHSIYGDYLYHPHSLLLPLWLEAGLFGIIFILVFFIQLFRAYLRLKNKGYEIFSLSILIGSLGIFSDLILLKNWNASFIYWLFFLAMLKMSQLDSSSTVDPDNDRFRMQNTGR